MNDTIGFFIIAAGIAIIGGFVGYVAFLFRNKPDKLMQKILNSPKLLIEELKKHGKIYDIGRDSRKEEVEFTIEMDVASGKEQVKIVRHPIPEPKPPKEKSSEEKPKKKRKGSKAGKRNKKTGGETNE